MTPQEEKQLKHYNKCQSLIADCKICIKIFDKLAYNEDTEQFYFKETN